MTKWQKIIEFLKDKGMTQSGITAECGCTAGAISLLANGNRKTPMYDLGNRLTLLAHRLGYQETSE